MMGVNNQVNKHLKPAQWWVSMIVCGVCNCCKYLKSLLQNLFSSWRRVCYVTY